MEALYKTAQARVPSLLLEPTVLPTGVPTKGPSVAPREAPPQCFLPNRQTPTPRVGCSRGASPQEEQDLKLLGSPRRGPESLS